ncbi:23S rRNA pseudouridine(1911/1915/1917) synthase RluD [Candidatus Pantoea edessiphila]|uniref:Pseudouridine synthase n=1 Tax=Candidatus Pantoea edessiphila TaxID=2044610 RepID=A0A2P5T1K3_9GAMM|nr:23S rRNA pseudouridine(1911/1915/1917) synthase RluD [Candidatus Pantoea edessiphila]PPI88481.1 23S rRNA pseudouridine(1911/1915/1917) synthase RluD [Candidatus Pantoea edessiphila]
MLKKIQHTFTLPKTNCNERLDKALKKYLPLYSRSSIKNWILNQYIKLNGIIIDKPKKKISGGELITINALSKERLDSKPQNLPLNILYEDEYILIVNKQNNFVMHPGANHFSGTLLNALLYKYPNIINVPRAGIVHRLDKNTTGLIIVAKTLKVQSKLIKMLQRREITREYEGIIAGKPPISGTINKPISRHLTKRTKMMVNPQGKPAITHYNVIEYFRNHSHIRIRLETGRTHQIRVHMAYIRHPLLGDPVYGKPFILFKETSNTLLKKSYIFNRQALHATTLNFYHPITNIQMKIDIPIPNDMNELISIIKEI